MLSASHVRSAAALCAAVALSLLAVPRSASAFNFPSFGNHSVVENDGVQMTFEGVNVHVCNPGEAMVGVDAANNRFLCASKPGIGTNNVTIDKHTHMRFAYNGAMHRVHVCPGASFMVGWNRDHNWLACSGGISLNFASGHVDGPGGTQVPEPRHPEINMHACNVSGSGTAYAMVGIEYNDNVLICR